MDQVHNSRPRLIGRFHRHGVQLCSIQRKQRHDIAEPMATQHYTNAPSFSSSAATMLLLL